MPGSRQGTGAAREGAGRQRQQPDGQRSGCCGITPSREPRPSPESATRSRRRTQNTDGRSSARNTKCVFINHCFCCERAAPAEVQSPEGETPPARGFSKRKGGERRVAVGWEQSCGNAAAGGCSTGAARFAGRGQGEVDSTWQKQTKTFHSGHRNRLRSQQEFGKASGAGGLPGSALLPGRGTCCRPAPAERTPRLAAAIGAVPLPGAEPSPPALLKKRG